MKATLAALLLLFVSPTADAQQYKAALPENLESFPLSQVRSDWQGISFDASALADRRVAVPAVTRKVCDVVSGYKDPERDGGRWHYVSDKDKPCAEDFTGGHSYEKYSNPHFITIKPARFRLAQDPLSSLNRDQYECVLKQSGALKGLLNDVVTRTFFRDRMGVKNVVITLEDNGAGGRQDSALVYGPDFQTSGALKLNVVRTSLGECLFADSGQLSEQITHWQNELAFRAFHLVLNPTETPGLGTSFNFGFGTNDDRDPKLILGTDSPNYGHAGSMRPL